MNTDAATGDPAGAASLPEPASESPGSASGATGRPRFLFVCTANRVRSPLAAAVARRHLQRLGIDAQVRSAGFLQSGLAADTEMVAVADKLGLDLRDHLSTSLDVELLEGSDVIVAMTGEHVLDLVGISPDCRPRTLTLREWAAASEAGHPVRGWERAELRRWAAEVTERSLGLLLSGELDVADPVGRPRRHYRRTATEIEALLATAFAPSPADTR